MTVYQPETYKGVSVATITGQRGYLHRLRITDPDTREEPQEGNTLSACGV